MGAMTVFWGGSDDPNGASGGGENWAGIFSLQHERTLNQDNTISLENRVFNWKRHVGAMNVTFVSVTQEFNTTTSLGRLTLNILLSFAQFEREIISERTRDKMAAAR